MLIGMTSGCFDLLHDGHRHFLRESRKHCDRLIVALNSNSSARRLKGDGRPVDTEEVRATNLLRTGLVFGINLFNTEAELDGMIEAIQPDVYFKGDEYRGKPLPNVCGANIMLIPMLPGYSTTAEIARRA